MSFISESSQTDPNWDKSPGCDIISSIKFKRKELLDIKARLLDIVQNPLYWTTLTEYLTSDCSKQNYDEIMLTCLTTNEARVLHNELIRTLLFNSHFSPIPPPGIPIPHKEMPDNFMKLKPEITRIDNKWSKDYKSITLGHIPSIAQLATRVSNQTSLKVDNSAIAVLFSELKHYIVTILKYCVDYNLRISDHSANIILPSQISYIISNYHELNRGEQNQTYSSLFVDS